VTTIIDRNRGGGGRGDGGLMFNGCEILIWEDKKFLEMVA
jgi:hypothetical protein